MRVFKIAKQPINSSNTSLRGRQTQHDLFLRTPKCILDQWLISKKASELKIWQRHTNKTKKIIYPALAAMWTSLQANLHHWKNFLVCSVVIKIPTLSSIYRALTLLNHIAKRSNLNFRWNNMPIVNKYLHVTSKIWMWTWVTVNKSSIKLRVGRKW